VHVRFGSIPEIDRFWVHHQTFTFERSLVCDGVRATSHVYSNTLTMPSLSTVREANAQFAPSYTPVALFVGGTSGIGQAMAEGLARYTNGNAHIIICGRNRQAAESIIASLPKPTPASDSKESAPSSASYEFVQCDASLMKNVGAMTTDLLARLPKINFLVLSPGYLSLKGLDPTKEGIGKQLALNYYARWKFINDLMPLLRNAKDAGEDAKVYSVLAAGDGQKMDMDDLGLKKTFGFVKNLKIAPTYNDLMMEVSRYLNNLSPSLSSSSIGHIFSLSPGIRYPTPGHRVHSRSSGRCEDWHSPA
jgi:NAD(P)-dependent dehydrogenase (short-subunit alcohol dehydrogenase family)